MLRRAACSAAAAALAPRVRGAGRVANVVSSHVAGGGPSTSSLGVGGSFRLVQGRAWGWGGVSPAAGAHVFMASRGYKADVVDVRNGMVIDKDGKLMVVIKAAHTQGTARQMGNVQLELRDMAAGTKGNDRYRAGDKVEIVRLDDKMMTYLYDDGDSLVFMDPDSYEQVEIDRGMIGDLSAYLDDGMQVKISLHEGGPVAVSLPEVVVQVVADTPPHLQGAQQAATYKPATLANGRVVSVPAHISNGDSVAVLTKDESFVRREAKAS